MSIVNTSTIGHTAAGPAVGTINIGSGSGNDRMLVVVLALSDSNPESHSVVLDPLGGDEHTASVNFALTEATDVALNDLWVASYYILDADLPATSGVYNIEVQYSLNDSSLSTLIYYMEGREQVVPEITSVHESITTDTVVGPTISPSSGADVVDVIASTELIANIWTPDSGQVELYDAIVGSKLHLSSYASGTGESTIGWTRDSANGTKSNYQIVVSVAPSGAGPSVGPISQRHLYNLLNG